MYRLHNQEVKAKIDWLVKNDNLLDKKLVIVTWNDTGMECMEYLQKKWGEEVLVLDDEVAAFNKNVYCCETLENKKEYLYLAQYVESSDIVNRLYEYGVSEDNILYIKGDLLMAQDALEKCCQMSSIKTVLDIGCGKGNHSNIFAEFGKCVTGIDAGFTCRTDTQKFKFIKGDFETYQFEEKYDLVWCSHVLEHQLNVENFIKKIFSCVKDNGYVCITVPDEMNGWVIEGHVHFWNAGQLMCNIIHCGFSCRHAEVKTYAGNVSVLVPKEPIEKMPADYRMMASTREYYPANMICKKSRFGGVFFDGNIESLNWE